MTTMTTTTSSPTLLSCFPSSKPFVPKFSLHLPRSHNPKPVYNAFSAKPLIPEAKRDNSRTLSCYAARRKSEALATSSSKEEGNDNLRRVLQIALWVAEGVYILWLFLLPYAPVSTLFQFFYLPFLLVLLLRVIFRRFIEDGRSEVK